MREEPTKSRSTRRPLQIGKYDVIAHIATGGMGTVYKAVDRNLHREVALKILPPAVALKPAMIERFRREARNAAKLRHENIVAIYEFDAHAGTYYLAMEYVEGTDLQEYIDRKGILPVDETVNILRQALLALDHAHSQGVVHRDIKPSNLMLTRRGEDLLVKLTDMGLARHADDEDAGPLAPVKSDRKPGQEATRLTQAGTTVGTVDYMAPEQARDSSAADIRSDLYSLGCTVFHMLTGQPPFPEGSMTERLYKHIEEEPPDIRTLNPKVPPRLVTVINSLMAKKPRDRYQTPAEVLEALGDVLPPSGKLDRRDVLAALTQGKAEPPALEDTRSRQPGPKQRSGKEPSSRVPPARQQMESGPAVRLTRKPKPAEEETPPSSSRQWLVIVGVGAVAIIAAAVVLGTTTQDRPKKNSTESTEPPAVHSLTEMHTTQPPGPEPVKVPQPPKAIVWPVLYTPSTPIDPSAMRQELEAPWAGELPTPADAPGVVVSRSVVGTEGKGRFGSLSAAAWVPAEKDATTVYQLQDPGPLFEPSVAWIDRNVVIRGAAGGRSLVVWDVGLKDRKSAFLTVVRGNLTLENLDVVLKWPETTSQEPTALLNVVDGNLTARNCTFSVSGTFHGSLALARLEGAKAGCRCRLEKCFARGANLTALDLQAPGVEALMEDCLVAGGDQPLVHVLGRNQPATTVRTAHSTLVGGLSFLSVRPASAADTKPAVQWLGWDALIARSRELPGGNLIELADNAEAAGLKWDGVNCLYAGWKTLLHDREPIPAGELSRWRERVQSEEGDRVVNESWPLAVRHDPAELLPTEYEIAPGSAVAFAATPEAGVESRPLGCPLASLPSGRTAWLAQVFDRYPVSPAPVLGAPADIPAPVQGLYQGEAIDRGRVPDLGAYLQEIQQRYRLGPKIVLRLSGTGDWSTSPIQIKGHSLVLRFEEPPQRETMPLALVAHSRSASGLDALITVEGGDLELEGVEIRLPGLPSGLPQHLIQVKGGNLRIRNSRLIAAVAQAPTAYHSLVSFQGSGDEAPGKALTCAILDSALVSGHGGLEVVGGGARVHVEQSVVAAGTEAVRFQLDGVNSKVNVQCTLDHATLASRKVLVAVGDAAPKPEAVREPLILQSFSSAFLAPYSAEQGKALPQVTLLLAEGDALGRGLILWQGDGSVYDKRIHSHVLTDLARADRQQDPSIWSRLWGTAAERGIHDKAPTLYLNPIAPQILNLAMQPGLGLSRPGPGADLTRPVFRRPLRTPN